MALVYRLEQFYVMKLGQLLGDSLFGLLAKQFNFRPIEYCCRITPSANLSLLSAGVGLASLRSLSENNITPS